MQLSKHFTLREMTNSMTAQRKGIDNTPGAGEIKSLGDLCYIHINHKIKNFSCNSVNTLLKMR